MARRQYHQFCPVAKALDLLGERWTLLVVRELTTGPKRYSELRRALTGMASNLLAVRLDQLVEAGYVERLEADSPGRHHHYTLTARGRALREVLAALTRHGIHRLGLPDEVEPLLTHLLPESLAAMIRPEELDDGPLTIRFALDEIDTTLEIAPAGPPGRRRPVLDRITPHVARATLGDGPPRSAPGAPPLPPADVTVRGSIATVLWVRRGDMSLDDAVAAGLLELTGPADAVEKVAHLYSPEPPSAHDVAPAQARGGGGTNAGGTAA